MGHWAHKSTLGMRYHIIWVFPSSPMVQASALERDGWPVDWLIRVTYCTHEVRDCMAKGASIWSFHLHGISYNVWCNLLQVVDDKWWWFWDNTCRELRKKEIMGHAWPLIRTCGWTVPTFGVTWFLSPSWVLRAGKAQRSGQSTNLDHLWHISKISRKFKLLLPLALIQTKRLFPVRVMNIMLQDSFSVRTMESTPVSTPTLSICDSTYPWWALGAGATIKRWNNKSPCHYLDRMALD